MVTILDRNLDQRWLDAALSVARKHLPIREARTALRDRLGEPAIGKVAWDKTLTVLNRVWLAPSARRQPETLWALDRASHLADWRPLHVGALLLSEPFFRDFQIACTLEQRASGVISTTALRGRMRDAYGVKRIVDYSTQFAVQTSRQLGLLDGEFGTPTSTASAIPVADPLVSAWLVTCLLRARGAESIAVEDLSLAPELFGMELPPTLPRSGPGVAQHTEGVNRAVFALDATA